MLLSSAVLSLALMSGQVQIIASQPPAPATASASPSTRAGTASAETGAETTPGQRVCRDVAVTGSRFPVRRCHTVGEVPAHALEGREMLRRMQGARVPPAS